MKSHLWCPKCDVMAEGDGPDHSCGTKLHAVPHGVDMTELVLTAQAMTGLLSIPPGFDPSAWDLDAIQEDLDRRDELMAITQAEAEALA